MAEFDTTCVATAQGWANPNPDATIYSTTFAYLRNGYHDDGGDEADEEGVEGEPVQETSNPRVQACRSAEEAIQSNDAMPDLSVNQ